MLGQAYEQVGRQNDARDLMQSALRLAEAAASEELAGRIRASLASLAPK